MTAKGFELEGKYSQNPIGSEGKSLSQRKAYRDGRSWTPTESRKREQLLKQFCKLEGQSGNSEAYVNSPVWCPFCRGRRMNSEEGIMGCEPCQERQLVEWVERQEAHEKASGLREAER